MRFSILTSLLTVAILGLVGCGVKKQVHQKALDELATCQGDLGTCTTARTKAETEADELRTKLASETEARTKAESSLAELEGNLQTTEAELADLRKQREAAEARVAAYRALRDRLRALVDTGKLSVKFRNGQMVLELPAHILFPSAKAKLSKAGQVALAEVADVLLEFKDRRFMIAGHTDNKAIRTRKFPNNWHLSTARAVSVVDFFIEKGFDPNNLAAAGYGEFDPVAPNDTEEGRQLNRRIEIILVPDLSELPNLTEEPAS